MVAYGSRMRTVPVVVALVLLAGCGTADPADPAAPAAAPPAPATGAPSTVVAAPALTDAEGVIGRLKKAGLGLTGAAVQTEDTDPNNLLGRPNGYTSRASADLPGGDKQAEKYAVDRGLVIEVFGTPDQAKVRADYIAGLQRDNPLLGTEWHYFAGAGTTLVRVSGKVKPSLAKKVGAAVASS